MRVSYIKPCFQLNPALIILFHFMIKRLQTISLKSPTNLGKSRLALKNTEQCKTILLTLHRFGILSLNLVGHLRSVFDSLLRWMAMYFSYQNIHYRVSVAFFSYLLFLLSNIPYHDCNELNITTSRCVSAHL